MSLLDFLSYRRSDNYGQSFSGITGTMAAALALGGTVWAYRYPAAATRRLFIPRLHVHYACLASFTAPVSAGRQLQLVRGAGADASGGTALDTRRHQSNVSAENLGSGQIATTAGLTTTGITFESVPFRRLMLTASGIQGDQLDEVWDYDGDDSPPLILVPGELVALRTPAQFDAAGTWQLKVDGSAVEL